MKATIILISRDATSQSIIASIHKDGVDAVYPLLASSLPSSFTLRLDVEALANMSEAEWLNAIHTPCFLDVDSSDKDDLTAYEERALRLLGFRWCDRCGAIVLPQERNNPTTNHWGRFGSTETQRLCEACFRNYVASQNALPLTTKKIRFSGYHGTSSQVCVINGTGENYTLQTVLGLGIEMEYNGNHCKRLDYNGDLEVPAEYAVYAEGKVRHERDCTVEGEFITNVFTEKSFREFNWDLFCHCLKSIGNEEDYPNTGFHVHFSKLWFGRTAKEQARNFIKFQMAFKCYEDDLKIVSGRKGDFQWCSFADMRTLRQWLRHVESLSDSASDWQAFDPFRVVHGASGCAVIASGATIEVRIGHSTNDAERLRHYVELLLGIVKACPVTNANKMYCLNKILRFVPKETKDYWHKKGAFLRTKAVDDRGFNLN